MPVKKTTKTNSEVLEVSKKKVVSKVKSNENRKKDTKEGVRKELKKDTKKVVVKRRKTDLKPTKASAVAIASQANRAKKQALIEKVSNSDIIPVKKPDTADTKIPLWVWVFFGCSLLLFCVSFYQAIIRPQLWTQVVEIPVNEDINRTINEDGNVVWEVNLWNEDIDRDDVRVEDVTLEDKNIEKPGNPEELIQAFFGYMSDWKFDDSFALFDSKAQNDQNIKKYFWAFKMEPFFEWIEWKSIVPQNVQETEGVYKWRNVYTFDISYTLESNHEQYDETWEFVPGEYDWEWKISRIYCITSKCSRHPIFWPEDFGLMR